MSRPTSFVQVCVYEGTNFGGSYPMNPRSIEVDKVPAGLPHEQNFTWGESYLPDKGTACAIAPEATLTPTVQPTAIPTSFLVTAVPTATMIAPTLVPTEVPTETPVPVVIETPVPQPTDTPTPVPTAELPPPVQLPSEFLKR